MIEPPQDDGPEDRPGQQAGPSSPPPPHPQYGPPPLWRPPGPPSSGHGQPDHGPPRFGPPAFGAPRRMQRRKQRRLGLVAAIAVLAVLLLGGAVFAAVQLRSTALDPRAVERDVSAQFQHQEGVAVQLDCEDDMRVQTGRSYECTGVTADGEDVTLRITITDEEQGAYTWTEP